MDYLCDDNFMIYAAHFYSNRTCASQKEFEEDLSRIKFIHKMFKRYKKDNIINERLILNHLILLYNVFEREAITKMLVLKLYDYLDYLKPFLILLNYWPERIENYNGRNSMIIGSDIKLNEELVSRLRKI